MLAAAGAPSIKDELLTGKQIGDRNYRVHLDGYNQIDLITGKGPSKRNEVFYFTEGTLGAVRINDYKYRFTDQPNGWLELPKRLTGQFSQTSASIPWNEREFQVR